MTDPRKPIHRPDNPTQDAVRQIAHAHLMEVTKDGATAIGCTGASFVILGVGIWAHELSELDARASAQMLRSLADIYDPATNETKKMHAERKRQSAVKKLFAALDLEIVEPNGSA